MRRTLTLVSLLALLAGLSLGFFAAKADPPGVSAPDADPVLERKVDFYREYYDLTPEQTQAIRNALREYEQGLVDLFRRLRVQHQDDFKRLSKTADDRIQNVLSGAGRAR